MNDNPGEAPFEEPANLKFLRRLVTTLTATMIIGLVILIGLIVIRLQTPANPIAFPDTIMLPAGVTAEAFTQTQDWYAIVTTEGEILVYNAATGNLQKRIDFSTKD